MTDEIRITASLYRQAREMLVERRLFLRDTPHQQWPAIGPIVLQSILTDDELSALPPTMRKDTIYEQKVAFGEEVQPDTLMASITSSPSDEDLPRGAVVRKRDSHVHGSDDTGRREGRRRGQAARPDGGASGGGGRALLANGRYMRK